MPPVGNGKPKPSCEVAGVTVYSDIHFCSGHAVITLSVMSDPTWEAGTQDHEAVVAGGDLLKDSVRGANGAGAAASGQRHRGGASLHGLRGLEGQGVRTVHSSRCVMQPWRRLCSQDQATAAVALGWVLGTRLRGRMTLGVQGRGPRVIAGS